MFKGLKSKLEDQSKKLQASVAQYGEQLSEQIGNIRTAASDAGSDAGGSISRRFMNTVGGSNNGHPSLEDSLNHSVGNALMEEVTEADLLGLDLPRRERRLSGGSTHSNESAYSTFFQSVPGMTASTLDDIDSDRESILEESASGISRATDKEHISSVLSKLQGSAGKWKGKYTDLVKRYNNVVTENNKCRTVLEHNQDQAMERYRKLKAQNKELSNKIQELQEKGPESAEALRKCEGLLEKCKEKISQQKAEIEKLRASKEHAEGESGMADFASERIAAEWKQKIDKVEEDWNERLTRVESDLMDQVASAKKETYNVMESKDKEIEVLRSRCHELEFQDGQANERWQKRVDELQSIVQALETEKTDMVEKLSAAKTQGVQAVRDEEAVKREALLAEWREKESRWVAEADERVEAAEREHKEALAKMTSELESLRAMQERGASQTDELKATERGLEIQLAELEEKLAQAQTASQQQSEELNSVVEDLTAKHKAQVADFIREHEELLNANKAQADVERTNLTDTVAMLQGELEQMRKQVEEVQKGAEEQKRTLLDDHQLKQKSLNEELTKCQEELEELKEKSRKQTEEMKAAHGKELATAEKELERLRLDLDESITESSEEAEKASASKKESEEQLVEMRTMLEERNHSIHRLENEKQELESELAQSRELSGIHEHLRGELDEARKQKQETEVKLLVAEKTVQELQEASAKTTVSETDVKTNGDVVEDLIQLETAPTLEATKVADSEVDKFKERLSELERRNEELDGRLAALTAEREELQEKLSTVSTREGELSAKHEEELSAMRDTWEALETEKSALSSRLDSLQSETTAIIQDLRKRADAADSLLEAEKEAKKNIEEQLAEAREKLSQQEALLADNEESKKAAEQLKELAEQRNSLESQLQQSEEKLKEALDQWESVKTERDFLAEKMNETTAAEQNLTVEITTLKEKLEQAEVLRTERDSMAEKIKEFAASEQQLTADIASLKQKLEEADARIQDLVVEKSKLAVQSEELTTQKKEVEGKMAGLQEQADRLLAEKTELSNRADDATKLTSLVEQEKARVDDLEQQYKSKLAEKDTLLSDELTKNEALAKELASVKASLEGSETKEKIISELRAQLDKAREEATAEEKAAGERLQAMEEKLKSAMSEMEASAATLQKLQTALDEAKVGHEAAEKEWTSGKEEEIRIREQYSIALENSKTELTDAYEKIKTLEGFKEEAARLQKQLQEASEAHEQSLAELNKEKEAVVAEWTEKAKKAVHKQKKLAEDEASSAKAEFILQVEELRSKVAEKERKLDDVVLEKARLEQELIAQEAVKDDLEQRKEKEKTISAKLSESEHRLMELEAENSVLGERKTELEKTKTELTAELEERSRALVEQEQQIKVLSENNDEAIRKAAAKQDTDSKKVIRELQKEVKQLYVELNEKAEAVDSLKAQLEEAKNNNQPAVSVKATTVESTPQKDFMYEEELEAMRRKLKESHREIDELKDINSRLERNLDSSRKSQNSAPKTNGQASLSMEYSGFADPAEAEYLKNVLYRYMVERESLGKECVTLARVIGTVAKFNKTQLDAVLAREEYRLSGWVGGAVGLTNVLNGARP